MTGTPFTEIAFNAAALVIGTDCANAVRTFESETTDWTRRLLLIALKSSLSALPAIALIYPYLYFTTKPGNAFRNAC